MSNERFITPAEVIKIVFPSSGMNEVLIKDNYIEVAQRAYLRPRLGDTLYNSLVTNGLGTNAEQARLFKTALAYWVAYVASPFISVKVSSSGMVKIAEGENIPLDRLEKADVRANYITMATSFIDDYIDLLEDADNALLEAEDETEIIGGIVIETSSTTTVYE